MLVEKLLLLSANCLADKNLGFYVFIAVVTRAIVRYSLSLSIVAVIQCSFANSRAGSGALSRL